MRAFRYILMITLVLAITFVGDYAQAAECRKTNSVVNSAASVLANTNVGGHVSIHVTNQPTQVGKSRFTNENDFTKAFTNWKNATNIPSPNPKVCGGGNQGLMDCVSASALGITSGNVCTAVNNLSICTNFNNITPEKVAFRYAKNSSGIWILNTSYPSMNSNCQ